MGVTEPGPTGMTDSLAFSIGAFLAAALVIAAIGPFLSATADRLADKTGMGEAFFGAIFLAGITSLPDFAATGKAALDSRPVLAMSNIMGSMAVNLVVLSIGDVLYRKANLEHVAASTGNLVQAALAVALLAIPLLAIMGPEVYFLGIHPATPLLIAAYVFGFRLVREAETKPMWKAQVGEVLTGQAQPHKQREYKLSRLWLTLGMLAALIALAGWALMASAETIADRTGLSETTVGALLTALSTSSPELVTVIAAVRQGALVLAVGNVVGTNCFNTLVIAAADVAYREGSIYHAITSMEVFWGVLTILLTAILLMGMVRREARGIANIGFESFLILILYAGAVLLLLAIS